MSTVTAVEYFSAKKAYAPDLVTVEDLLASLDALAESPIFIGEGAAAATESAAEYIRNTTEDHLYGFTLTSTRSAGREDLGEEAGKA